MYIDSIKLNLHAPRMQLFATKLLIHVILSQYTVISSFRTKKKSHKLIKCATVFARKHQ